MMSRKIYGTKNLNILFLLYHRSDLKIKSKRKAKMRKENVLRRLLKEGKPSLGTHVVTPWAGMFEVIGNPGFSITSSTYPNIHLDAAVI